jgi:hypothetical protein
MLRTHSYCATTSLICTTILKPQLHNGTQQECKIAGWHYTFPLELLQDACCIVGTWVFHLHCGCFMKNVETWVNGTCKTWRMDCSDTRVGEWKLAVPILCCSPRIFFFVCLLCKRISPKKYKNFMITLSLLPVWYIFTSVYETIISVGHSLYYTVFVCGHCITVQVTWEI